jgi:hypothetical protein
MVLRRILVHIRRLLHGQKWKQEQNSWAFGLLHYNAIFQSHRYRAVTLAPTIKHQTPHCINIQLIFLYQ